MLRTADQPGLPRKDERQPALASQLACIVLNPPSMFSLEHALSGATIPFPVSRRSSSPHPTVPSESLP
ncbi:unnamed protein product [Periconia digitata]|uniref:Uncharacterized protein n=1 Tax=Periconia digitata TaxID=1303443 RepID=A0A9W4UBT6_9PLEO|nr:unnamed protein product [Periconia digitata]